MFIFIFFNVNTKKTLTFTKGYPQHCKKVNTMLSLGQPGKPKDIGGNCFKPRSRFHVRGQCGNDRNVRSNMPA